MVGIVSQAPGPISYELLEAPGSLYWLARNGKQPYTGQRGLHPDGWGLLWRQGGMRLEKRGRPAGEDPEFVQWASQIESDMVIAHIRKASNPSTVSDQNAHPFSRGDLFLAHNGAVDGLPQENPVDSENLLAWLAGRWDRTEEGLVSLVREARGLRHTSLSFLMTDGRALYALRQVTDKPHFLEYYTLFLLETPKKAVVASEPLDGGTWKALANGTLVVLAPGQTPRRLKV